MMKYTSIIILMFLVACSTSVNKINIENIEIPNLDSSDYFDPAYKAAWNALQLGDPKKAMESFQNSTIEDDKLFVGYGFVFLMQKKFNFAEDNFNKSLKINPDNLFAGLGIGILYEIISEDRKAFDIYSQLKIKFPDNPVVARKHGQLKLNKTEGYIKEADKFKGNDEEKYIDAIRNALYFSPEKTELKIDIAQFYENNEQPDKAIRYYEQIIEESPDLTEVYYKLAALFENRDQIDEAVVVYQRLLKLKPDDISISNKINDLKIKFFDKNLPLKFKDIFFKSELTKEDLAALIGFYFKKYLASESIQVKIITDIGSSFARKEIILLCSLNIMKVRPDHRFSRRTKITRAHFAKVISSLLTFLNNQGYKLNLQPSESPETPADVPEVHKDYNLITRLVQSKVMKLDDQGNFNQIEPIIPADAISSIKRILNSISSEFE